MPDIGEAGLKKLNDVLKSIWRRRISDRARDEAYDILRRRKKPSLERAVERGIDHTCSGSPGPAELRSRR